MAADIYEIGQMRSRYQGCLLGGAVGDALGYPVEFMEEDAIRSRYGPGGIQTLEQAGRDNVTALVIRVSGDDRSMWQRALSGLRAHSD